MKQRIDPLLSFPLAGLPQHPFPPRLFVGFLPSQLYDVVLIVSSRTGNLFFRQLLHHPKGLSAPATSLLGLPDASSTDYAAALRAYGVGVNASCFIPRAKYVGGLSSSYGNVANLALCALNLPPCRRVMFTDIIYLPRRCRRHRRSRSRRRRPPSFCRRRSLRDHRLLRPLRRRSGRSTRRQLGAPEGRKSRVDVDLGDSRRVVGCAVLGSCLGFVPLAASG